MRLIETPEQRAFRAEARAFMETHLTDEVHRRVLATGTIHDWGFHRALGERGWIGLNWATPEGSGPAHEEDPLMAAILYEEAHRAWAPMYGINTTMGAANALIRCAAPDLRDEVLPRVRRGEVIIALGFSEPHSGSDIALAKTTITPTDGGWLVNGQKVFTSLAEEAEYIFLVGRTSEGARKNDGLTTLLVPTRSPGLDVTPLYTVAERTNVTYYNDVFVPDHYRIGAPERGWDVLRVALSIERGGKGFHGHLLRLLDDLLRALPEGGSGFRGEERLPEAFLEDLGRAVTEAEVARLLDYRTAAISARGGLPMVEGSMAKLFSSESLTTLVTAFIDHLGAAGLLPMGHRGAIADGWIEYLHRFAIPTTVYGGVAEVQRSLVAEHRLGLPRSRA